MSPQQIDRVIQAAVPELKIALESLLKTGAAAHTFTLAEGTNSATGIKTTVVCFIALEGAAAIIEGTLQGLAKAQEINLRVYEQLAGKGEEVRP